MHEDIKVVIEMFDLIYSYSMELCQLQIISKKRKKIKLLAFYPRCAFMVKVIILKLKAFYY